MTRYGIALLIAPAMGFLCFLAPTLIAGDAERLAVPESLNLVLRVFENVKPIPTAVLLVLAGFGLRYFAGRGTLILAGLLIIVFPAATLVGVLTASEQHNLLPFELAAEFACLAPALLGTFAASLLQRPRIEPVPDAVHAPDR